MFFGFSGKSEPAPVIDKELPEEPSRPAITFTAKHQYRGGAHIIAGETDMPTPCHILDWGVIAGEEIVIIDFTLSTEAEACAQVITPTRFKVKFEAPEGIELVVEDQKLINVKGIDKQLVGQTAAKIRNLRKPEPYKGKGIKYFGEVIKTKPGKAAKTA